MFLVPESSFRLLFAQQHATNQVYRGVLALMLGLNHSVTREGQRVCQLVPAGGLPSPGATYSRVAGTYVKLSHLKFWSSL
ncbi:MAG: hypothetical protein AB8B50_00195 [Pirellulaceae bacterium]